MIISASRRTDIPSLYTPWLLNRLRAGHVLVRNPRNRRQVSSICLDPAVIDGMVFWSKNPAPLLPYLHTITALSFPLVMHYTITGCDRHLEPRLPALEDRIVTFQTLSRHLGPECVLWRFDPILLTPSQDVEDIVARFATLTRRLHGYTRQCTISFVSLYAKCRRKLAGTSLQPTDDAVKIALARRLNAIARSHDIRLVACCDALLTDRCGIEQGRCIDADQIGALAGSPLLARRDAGQRPACGCCVSVDIGAYDSCSHGCRYCYATTSTLAVTRNIAVHDPESPLLIGRLQGDEIIREREMRSLRPVQRSLLTESLARVANVRNRSTSGVP